MSYHLLVSSPRVGHHNYRLITPDGQERSPQYERLLTRLDQEVRNRLGPISKVYESDQILAISYDAQQLKGRLGSEVLILCVEHKPSERPQLLDVLEKLKPVVDELIKRSEVIEQGERTNLIYSDWLSTKLQEIQAFQALPPNKMLLSQLTQQLNATPQVPKRSLRDIKFSARFNPKVLAVVAVVLFFTIIALWPSPEQTSPPVLDDIIAPAPSPVTTPPPPPKPSTSEELDNIGTDSVLMKKKNQERTW